MPVYHSKLDISGSRSHIRAQVINAFLDELPGEGRGEYTTRYIYDVESTALGDQVILRRPAPLNKGVDFIVHASRTRFLNGQRTYTNPAHHNILADLLLKQEQNRKHTDYILCLITQIYECNVLEWSKLDLPSFSVGIDTELLLKLIKWLFIEQDVTYWNWSGRNMLYTRILEALS